MLLLSSLLILLAARLELSELTGLGLRQGLFVFTPFLIARSLAMTLSSIRSRLTWRERLFLAWMAPRGVVAASVTWMLTLQMKSAGYAQAEQIVLLTFLVIVATVVI